MSYTKFYSYRFLFSISCSLCFYFLLTLNFQYLDSKPWDFFVLMQTIGFISFISSPSPLFFSVLGALLLVALIFFIFRFTYRLQKRLMDKKIITPSVSAFGLGILVCFMITATHYHKIANNYYHHGVNNGHILGQQNVFDTLYVAFKDEEIDCEEANSTTIMVEKGMRTIEVLEINQVKTIRICNTPY